MENNQLWHRLVWMPCELMHGDWWKVLGVDAWRTQYARMPESAKRALNLEVQRRRQRYGAITHLLHERSPLQETLLHAIHRLPALVVALGLSLSHCPDYFTWRPYRQALTGLLNPEQLTQLGSLWRGGSEGNRGPDISPDELVNHLLHWGTSVLHNALSGDPVWQAIRYTLPNPCANAIHHGNDVVALFLRLERFL